MTKKRELMFSIVRGLLAILIALLVATLLIFISANGDNFSEKLASTGDALKQMLVGPLFRMGKNGTRFETKRLTDIPGASDYYLGGVCSYSNSVKEKVLGVKKETLDTVGAVSPETAEQMAVGVANALGSDIGVGITGIAGPGGGTEDKPTGLVYISVWYDGKFFTRKMQSSLGRDRVRMQAASTALDLIRRHIF